MKDDRLYVEHILECIERIQQYCKGSQSAFLEQQIVQDAVVRNLQILAESSKRLSPALKSAHGEIDWHDIAGFRNVLVHDYFDVNLRRVYQIVSFDLPVLKARMESIRTTLPQTE